MNAHIEYQIKAIIKKYFQTGKADQLKTAGLEEIKTVIRRSGGLIKDYKPGLYTLIKSVENDLLKEFQNERGTSVQTAIKKQLNSLIENTKSQLEGNALRAQEIIQKSLESTSKDWETTARRALQKIGVQERHINTEIETTKAALNNLKRFSDVAQAIDNNIELRYEGPESERDFCVAHLGKTYSLQEVEEMINDFGQPALAYSGGYNCRHRWVPVIIK